MSFSAIDWAIVFGYFILTAGIGFYFTRRGGSSMSEYFVSGRSVPWWLAGVSMVATTFAADTPLAVTGLVANNGVAGNWLWWNMVMSGILTVFFFARLWHRANVMTDVELAEVRYSGKAAAGLRGFRALYLGIPINLIVLGWVNKAMVTILSMALGIDPLIAVGICFVVTVAYSVAAGLWAVLWTDFFQFIIMMTAVIVLAVYAVDAVGGMAALQTKAAAYFGSEKAALSVLPVHVDSGGIHGYVWMPLMTLMVFISVQWWAAWYPGAEPGGGGYIAQRIFSSRSEKDGILATLFFQVAHYALRPWPWIITALATVVLYPNLGYDQKGEGYVRAFLDLLPTPWRGLMLAGFAAAYMSTVATQLNWGASYLVNDFYKRFMKPNAEEKHYVGVARVATVVLFLLSLAVSWQLTTVEGAWKFLIAIGAGTGLVLILRWYWWRINAWSEISAMIASFVTSLIAMEVVPRFYPSTAGLGPAERAGVQSLIDSTVLLTTVAVSTIAWITVTMLTRPEPDGVLDAFYRRVRPGGPGWRRVSERLGYGRESIPGGALAWTNWVAGVVAVYTSLFGIGKVVFGQLVPGLATLAVAVLAFAWIARSFREERQTPAPTAERAPAVGD
ncbi:MAG TPA: sodium:solute symporter family protein [Gemmatimonadaceae bacterium]|nr:sodium:solute symporter family protein [Gemmatimonadaceae bacterium]